MLSIVSIDIGLKTLSVYKEYFDYDLAKTFKKPSAGYQKNGEAKEELKDYILDVSQCGQCIFLDIKNLGERKDFFSGKAILNLYDYFDDLKNKDIFRDVDVIIMEKQLKINGMASVLMYHLHSWFLINFRNFKKTILYPAKNKTRILGAPLSILDEDGKKVKMDKRFRKNLAIQQASQILAKRKDEDTFNFIFKDNKSKKDDLSDTIIQCLSYHIKKLLK